MIHGFNQKHYYTFMEFGRRLSNLFWATVEFESNTTRALNQTPLGLSALVVFDLNSTVNLKSLTAFSQTPLVYNSVSTRIFSNDLIISASSELNKNALNLTHFELSK